MTQPDAPTAQASAGRGGDAGGRRRLPVDQREVLAGFLPHQGRRAVFPGGIRTPRPGSSPGRMSSRRAQGVLAGGKLPKPWAASPHDRPSGAGVPSHRPDHGAGRQSGRAWRPGGRAGRRSPARNHAQAVLGWRGRAGHICPAMKRVRRRRSCPRRRMVSLDGSSCTAQFHVVLCNGPSWKFAGSRWRGLGGGGRGVAVVVAAGAVAGAVTCR